MFFTCEETMSPFSFNKQLLIQNWSKKGRLVKPFCLLMLLTNVKPFLWKRRDNWKEMKKAWVFMPMGVIKWVCLCVIDHQSEENPYSTYECYCQDITSSKLGNAAVEMKLIKWPQNKETLFQWIFPFFFKRMRAICAHARGLFQPK